MKNCLIQRIGLRNEPVNSISLVDLIVAKHQQCSKCCVYKMVETKKNSFTLSLDNQALKQFMNYENVEKQRQKTEIVLNFASKVKQNTFSICLKY